MWTPIRARQEEKHSSSSPGDQILADDTVQGPALVGPGHLLSHRGEEALWVEESRDPENLKKI